MEIVNERSNCRITVTFKDEFGNLVVPTRVWYSIYCPDKGTVVVPDTEIIPSASSVDISVLAEQNSIIGSCLTQQKRLVTIRFTYDGGEKQGTAEYEYAVLHLTRV
jgi:hypothetical protein